MKFVIESDTEQSLEAFATASSVARTISKLQRISKDFLAFRELVTDVKCLDKSKPKYAEGKVGVSAPSSKAVGERNWEFYRVCKRVADSKGKINTPQELNKVYEELMNKEYLAAKSSGYRLAALPTHEIEFPKSGWFGFPLVNIERSIVLFPKLCKVFTDYLEGQNIDSGYQQVIEKLFSDMQGVIEKESLGVANKLKSKQKK